MGKLWDFGPFADSPALIGETGATITYRDLVSLSDETERLTGGTGGRSLVMFICRNTPGALAGYITLINLGYPVLPVSAELPAEMRKALMNAYRPGFLLLPGELCPAFPAMTEIRTFRDYALLRTNYGEQTPVHPELGLLITTSGSTGSAKFVRLSRDNLRFNASAIASYLQLSPSDRTVTCLPLQYTYGISMLHACLLRGAATVVTQNGVMDPEFWDLVDAEAVTCFHGVPNTYELLHRIGLFEDDFPSLRMLTQAGGKLSRELQAYYAGYAAKNGKRFVIMYGQSEATAAITWLPPEDALRKPGSAGMVIPGGKLRITDAEGNPAGAGVQGELCYEGPNVAMGYAQGAEDLALGDEMHGVLRTGDIAEIDGEGYVYITGRLKRYIKMAGHRVSLDEVDSMIMDELNIPSFSVGTDDHLTVFVTDDRYRDIITSFIRGKILTAHAGFRVLTVPAFPTNEGGKILYAALQAEAEKR